MCDVKDCYLCEVGNAFISNTGKGFHRGEYIPYKTVPLFTQRHNFFGTFVSTYRYNKPIPEQADLYGDLYLDFDDKDNFENVRQDALTALSVFKIVYKIPETQVKIYYSGNKGVHLIVPAEIFGVSPLPYLNGIYKMMAQRIRTFSPNKTIDLKIYDNKRLFRIPNTRHEKSGLYKIRITFDELKKLNEDSIKELARTTRNEIKENFFDGFQEARRQYQKDIQEYLQWSSNETKDKKFLSKINFVPPCIHKILETGAEEGQRNMTIAALSSFYKLYGKSLNETIEIISEWNAKNTVPTGAVELERTVKSIFNSYKTYGCSTFKSLTDCDESNCRFKIAKGKTYGTDKNKTVKGQRTSPYKRF